MNGKYQTALVRRLSQVAAGTFQLDLETAISDHVQPGQFVLLQPLAETSLLPRPFTVYFAQQGIFIRLVFEARGSNTRLYSQLKSGDKIRVLGPCGQPAVIDDSARLAIFIGGGCGLASLHWLAFAAGQKKIGLLCAAGFRDKDHVFSTKDFDRLGTPLEVATDDGSFGVSGTAVDLFQNIIFGEDGLPKNESIRVFTCGPTVMMREIARITRAEGIPCYVFLEEMMACGLGDCKSCAVRTNSGIKHVCKDGPIFESKEVIWDEDDEY